MTDLLLGVPAEQQHQSDDLRTVTPAETIAISARGQVVAVLRAATPLVGNDVIDLPAFAKLAAADVAGAARLVADLLSLSSRYSRFPDASACVDGLAED